MGKEILDKKVVRTLVHIGESSVNEAVNNGNYTDKTGNLRSSIGFVVANDGRVIEEGGFWNMGGTEGQAIGRALAYQKASETTEISLIVVAGMKYAQYVADKGYNVLDSAEIVIQDIARQLNR